MNEKRIVEEMTVKIHDEKIVKDFSKLINDLLEKFNRSTAKEQEQFVKQIEKILEDDSQRVAIRPEIKE